MRMMTPAEKFKWSKFWVQKTTEVFRLGGNGGVRLAYLT